MKAALRFLKCFFKITVATDQYNESGFKGIVKRQGGGVSGINQTVMTSHTIANVF
jgi:hypothetical protein